MDKAKSFEKEKKNSLSKSTRIEINLVNENSSIPELQTVFFYWKYFSTFSNFNSFRQFE